MSPTILPRRFWPTRWWHSPPFAYVGEGAKQINGANYDRVIGLDLPQGLYVIWVKALCNNEQAQSAVVTINMFCDPSRMLLDIADATLPDATIVAAAASYSTIPMLSWVRLQQSGTVWIEAISSGADPIDFRARMTAIEVQQPKRPADPLWT